MLNYFKITQYCLRFQRRTLLGFEFRTFFCKRGCQRLKSLNYHFESWLQLIFKNIYLKIKIQLSTKDKDE